MTIHVDTGENTLAIVVSLIGLGVGAIALGWQILSWQLSTSRVSAHLRWAARSGYTLMTMPPTREVPTAWFEAQGFDQLVLAADVRNHGRAAAFIENYAIHLATGTEVGYVAGSGTLAGLPAMPIRLEPEASTRVFVDVAGTYPQIALGHVANGTSAPELEAWMVVYLGTGKTVATKEKVVIRAPDDVVERARGVVAEQRKRSMPEL